MAKTIWQALLLALIISVITSYVEYWQAYYNLHVLNITPRDSDTMIWLSTGGIPGGILVSTLIMAVTCWVYFIPSIIAALLFRLVSRHTKHPALFIFYSLGIATGISFLVPMYQRFTEISTSQRLLSFSLIWVIATSSIATLFYWRSWRASESPNSWEE